MTDAPIHLSNATLRSGRLSAPLGRSLYCATIADGARRTLNELPDSLLRDIGIARSDIPFIAGELACADRGRTHDPLNRFDRIVVECCAAPRRLPRFVLNLAVVAVAAVMMLAVLSRSVLAQDLRHDRQAGAQPTVEGREIGVTHWGSVADRHDRQRRGESACCRTIRRHARA